MNDVFSKKEACDIWKVPVTTLESRLNRDRASNAPMYGTRKSAGVWLVTREFMEVHYGDKRKSKRR